VKLTSSPQENLKRIVRNVSRVGPVNASQPRVRRSVDAGINDWSTADGRGGSDAFGMRHLNDDDLVPALSAELGQDLRAAVYARADTVLSPARMLSPLGNYLIARPAARDQPQPIRNAMCSTFRLRAAVHPRLRER
jgi:hypothetical protein